MDLASGDTKYRNRKINHGHVRYLPGGFLRLVYQRINCKGVWTRQILASQKPAGEMQAAGRERSFIDDLAEHLSVLLEPWTSVRSTQTPKGSADAEVSCCMKWIYGHAHICSWRSDFSGFLVFVCSCPQSGSEVVSPQGKFLLSSFSPRPWLSPACSDPGLALSGDVPASPSYFRLGFLEERFCPSLPPPARVRRRGTGHQRFGLATPAPWLPAANLRGAG